MDRFDDAGGLTLAAQAADAPHAGQTSDLDELVGQPADLAPWAYAWRADRQVQEKPEAYFIPRPAGGPSGRGVGRSLVTGSHWNGHCLPGLALDNNFAKGKLRA